MEEGTERGRHTENTVEPKAPTRGLEHASKTHPRLA